MLLKVVEYLHFLNASQVARAFSLPRLGGLGHLVTKGALSNSWIITIIWWYIALNRTPNIDCYWVGAVPKVNVSGLTERRCWDHMLLLSELLHPKHFYAHT